MASARDVSLSLRDIELFYDFMAFVTLEMGPYNQEPYKKFMERYIQFLKQGYEIENDNLAVNPKFNNLRFSLLSQLDLFTSKLEFKRSIKAYQAEGKPNLLMGLSAQEELARIIPLLRNLFASKDKKIDIAFDDDIESLVSVLTQSNDFYRLDNKEFAPKSYDRKHTAAFAASLTPLNFFVKPNQELIAIHSLFNDTVKSARVLKGKDKFNDLLALIFESAQQIRNFIMRCTDPNEKVTLKECVRLLYMEILHAGFDISEYYVSNKKFTEGDKIFQQIFNNLSNNMPELMNNTFYKRLKYFYAHYNYDIGSQLLKEENFTSAKLSFEKALNELTSTDSISDHEENPVNYDKLRNNVKAALDKFNSYEEKQQQQSSDRFLTPRKPKTRRVVDYREGDDTPTNEPSKRNKNPG